MGTLNTVINFVSDSPVPPGPTPGGDPSGGLAQTGDMWLIVVGMLICVIAVSFAILKMRKLKLITANAGMKSIRPSRNEKFSGSKFPLIILATSAIFILLFSLMIASFNTNSAIAQNNDQVNEANGPLVIDKSQLTAWVNEETGQVTIDTFTVTNTLDEFYKFNTVTATKKAEYENVKWKIYLSNDTSFDESDVIYDGQANANDPIITRYIGSGRFAYVKIVTDMDKNTAVSLINQEVLSIDLSYIDTPVNKNLVTFTTDKNGTINPNSNGVYTIADKTATPVKYGTYYIDVSTGKLTINDGTESFDFEPIGDASKYYEFNKWLIGETPATVGTQTDIDSNKAFKATFKLKEFNVTYVDNIGTGTNLPEAKKIPAGTLNLNKDYDGKLGDQNCTGWVSNIDNKHYAMGATYVLTSDVTFSADYDVYTFKAVLDSSNNLTYYFDTSDHSGEGSVYAISNLNPKQKSDWGEIRQKVADIASVTIDESVKTCSLLSTDFMFADMTNLTEVNNLENLNWESILDATSMFDNCEKLMSITLPDGFVKNCSATKQGDRYPIFLNCGLNHVILEGNLIIDGVGVSLKKLWNDNGWTPSFLLNPDRIEISFSEPSFAGEYTTSIIKWNDSKIDKVFARRNTDSKQVEIHSGDYIPAFAYELLVKAKAGTASDYSVKIDYNQGSYKFDKNYSYDSTLGGVLVADHYLTEADVENLSIIEPKNEITVTLDWTGYELDDEGMRTIQQMGWNRVSDTKYTKAYVGGIDAMNVVQEFPPSESIHEIGHETYSFDSQLFDGWSLDNNYGSLNEDKTVTPVKAYKLQVYASPSSEDGEAYNPVTGDPLCYLHIESGKLTDYKAPSFCQNLSEKKTGSFHLEGDTAFASFPGMGSNIPVTPMSSDESKYKFAKWIYIDKDSVVHEPEQGKVYNFNSDVYIHAVFLPAGSTQNANIRFDVGNGIAVENAPLGWTDKSPVYTSSAAIFGSKLINYEADWSNTRFKYNNQYLKLLGWYKKSIYCDGKSFKANLRYVKDSDVVDGGLINVIPKFGVNVNVEATACSVSQNNLDIPVMINSKSGLSSVLLCDDDWSLKTLNFDLTQLIGSSNDPYDIVSKITMTPNSGASIVGWKINTSDGKNKTLFPGEGNNFATIPSGVYVIGIEALCTTETADVTLNFGNDVSVIDGQQPNGWTKVDAHTYKKGFPKNSSLTYGDAFREWTGIGNKLNSGDKVWKEWANSSELYNQPIDQSREFDAVYGEKADVNIKLRYSKFGSLEKNTVSLGPVEEFGKPSGKNFTTLSIKQTDDTWVAINSSPKYGEALCTNWNVVYKNQEDKVQCVKTVDFQYYDCKEILRLDAIYTDMNNKPIVASIGSKDVPDITYSRTFEPLVSSYEEDLYSGSDGSGFYKGASLWVANDGKLHIKDTISGYDDTVSYSSTSALTNPVWYYKGDSEPAHVSTDPANPTQIAGFAEKITLFVQDDPVNLLLNNNSKEGALVNNNVQENVSVNPQADLAEPAEPQVDPVPSEEGEGDVPLAAAALAVPALAAFGFRKRIRGKHVRIK